MDVALAISLRPAHAASADREDLAELDGPDVLEAVCAALAPLGPVRVWDTTTMGPAEIARERQRPVQVLQDGDFFGEIALVDNVPRTATVRACTACLLLVLAREEFQGRDARLPPPSALFEHTAHTRRPETGARLTTREPSA